MRFSLGIVKPAAGTPAALHPPNVRGSNIAAATFSSRNSSFPSGAQADDYCVVFVSHAFQVNIPSGWTQLDKQDGSNINGAVFAKTLTSGDISTGYVTITTTGSFNGVVAMIAFVGPTAISARNLASVRAASNVSSASVTTGSAPVAGDLGVYFSGTRSNSTNTVAGTQLQTVTSTTASGVLAIEAVSASGAYSRTFSFSGTSDQGYYDVILTMTQVILSVNYPAPTFTNGATVSLSPVYGDGSSTPYSFAVTAGTLPSGLSLDSSTGVISGTLTAANGSYPVTVTITDGGGFTTSTSVPFLVSADIYAKKWRLRANAGSQSNGDYHSAAEIQLRASAGGADQTVPGGALLAGGSFSSSGDFNGAFLSANAWDNSTSTVWLTNGTANPWIGYEFTLNNVTVQEVTWTAETSSAISSPTNVSVQYWDGSAWQTWWGFTASGWSAGQTKTFTK